MNSRISTEPTGFPAGGYYALVDGIILRRRQGHRYARVFLSEYRARLAARSFIREHDSQFHRHGRATARSASSP